MNETYMKEVRKRAKNIIKPVVMVLRRDKRCVLEVVYRNRIEIYELRSSHTKNEMDKDSPECVYDYEDIFGKGWNKTHEIEMLKANGYRKIDYRDEDKED